jgi:hypothetical protein
MDANTKKLLAQMAATLLAAIGEETPAKATPAKAAKADAQPADLVEAKSFCYEARINRRTAPENAANAKGLTKAEKSFLYHNFEDYTAAVIWFKELSADEQAELLAS